MQGKDDLDTQTDIVKGQRLPSEYLKDVDHGEKSDVHRQGDVLQSDSGKPVGSVHSNRPEGFNLISQDQEGGKHRHGNLGKGAETSNRE